jgi:polysaccharide export outer membrane protein
VTKIPGSLIAATSRFLSRGLLAFVLVLSLGTSAAGAQQGQSASFTLRPGDVVRVLVWREKEMSGDFTVDEAGRLVLPLVGERRVAQTPWLALRDSLLESYAKQLKNPSVTLTPLRRVLVMGEVTKPGQILLDPTMNFASAIALAGGANMQGDLRRVRIVRDGKTLVQQAPVDSLIFTAEVHSGDQLYVDRLSWFDRNSAFVASAALSLTGILVSLIRR